MTAVARKRELIEGQTLADDPSSYVADFLATSEGLALAKAFVCIEDAKLRRAIVRLVEEIVPETASTTARSARSWPRLRVPRASIRPVPAPDTLRQGG
jgi:hypothetical protein